MYLSSVGCAQTVHVEKREKNETQTTSPERAIHDIFIQNEK